MRQGGPPARGGWLQDADLPEGPPGQLNDLATTRQLGIRKLDGVRRNAEEQYQNRSVSIRYSDSFPLARLCTSASCEGSLSGHGSSRPVFDSGREG